MHSLRLPFLLGIALTRHNTCSPQSSQHLIDLPPPPPPPPSDALYGLQSVSSSSTTHTCLPNFIFRAKTASCRTSVHLCFFTTGFPFALIKCARRPGHLVAFRQMKSAAVHTPALHPRPQIANGIRTSRAEQNCRNSWSTQAVSVAALDSTALRRDVGISTLAYCRCKHRQLLNLQP